MASSNFKPNPNDGLNYAAQVLVQGMTVQCSSSPNRLRQFQLGSATVYREVIQHTRLLEKECVVFTKLADANWNDVPSTVWSQADIQTALAT